MRFVKPKNRSEGEGVEVSGSVWTPTADALVSDVGGLVRLESNSALPVDKYAIQSVTVVSGAPYRIRGSITGGEPTSELLVGDLATQSQYMQQDTQGAFSQVITPTGSLIFITLLIGSALGVGQAGLFGVSVRKLLR